VIVANTTASHSASHSAEQKGIDGGTGFSSPVFVSTARPFLKWAGGKRQSVPFLQQHLPSRFNRYIEPMVGAGALFFSLTESERLQGEMIIADINPELINVYRVIRDKLPKLIALLKKHKEKHSKRYFSLVRAVDRDPAFWTWNDVERAARFIYLNKTCFNGLYRVNSRGEFNVPFGDYSNPAICDEANLTNCSRVLKQTKIELGSFENIAALAKPGDLVYFDPPYEPLTKTSNFTQYARDGFGTADQIKLAEVFAELDRRGVRVMLSNSSAQLVFDLYANYKIVEIAVGRAINSKGAQRGKVKELLVKNF